MTVIFYVDGRRKALDITSFIRYYTIDTARLFNPHRELLPATYWQSKRGGKAASVVAVI